jgi:hypothetical protein
MLKKTVTYTDYNGVECTEDLYFNLTKAEIMEMEMSVEGGFAEHLEKMVAENNGPAIMKVFKDLILNAYGEKSADGKRFVKNDELREAFSQTEAYSQLFMELVTNVDAANDFLIAIIPSDLEKEVSKAMRENANRALAN